MGEKRKRPAKRNDVVVENGCVQCPECGRWQADMGHGVCCEECKHGPMPTAE